MTMRLCVNGATHTVDADPDTPLIFVLRNDLQLYGAKLGCGLEQCGSCLVLADGEPVYSCAVAVASVANRNIETIEGLVERENLHPIQQAFLAENAAQCGYCSAGIIMRVKALLAHTPNASREAIVQALDGHLCRCGAHPRILRAVSRLIDQGGGGW